MRHLSGNNHSHNLKNKFLQLNFFYIMLICCLAFIGTLTLYSAGNGNWNPWAWKHICRFGIAFVIMLGLAMVNMRFYYKYAYAFYFVVLLLLIAVEITGHIGMGAQRWIDVGFFKIQPSELMKIGLVLCLARYFDATTVQGIRSFRGLIIPARSLLSDLFQVQMHPLTTASFLLKELSLLTDLQRMIMLNSLLICLTELSRFRMTFQLCLLQPT